MKQDLKDILSGLHSEVDQETLLRYLQGRLTQQQQHEVEKNLLNDDFEAEAVEGLQDIKDKKNIQALVEALNLDLKRKTAKRHAWRQKRALKLDAWLLVSIVLILLMAVLGYVIIHLMKTH